MMHRLISFEGIEGVGKSTVIAHAHQVLLDLGHEVVLTREPGGTANAELIRDLILHPPTDEAWDSEVELMLMVAARLQHVRGLILPALSEGKWVLCDRFIDASYAYQGAGRGVSEDLIDRLHQGALKDVKPGLTCLLDAPYEVCVTRMGKREQVKDRIESESRAFFERVRAKYLSLCESSPKRFSLIQADRPLAEICEEITHLLKQYSQNHVSL